jgi:hypothetical protein
MKIISFIRAPRVIFRILDHLDMLAEPEGEPNRVPPDNSSITYQPLADFSALGAQATECSWGALGAQATECSWGARWRRSFSRRLRLNSTKNTKSIMATFSTF